MAGKEMVIGFLSGIEGSCGVLGEREPESLLTHSTGYMYVKKDRTMYDAQTKLPMQIHGDPEE